MRKCFVAFFGIDGSGKTTQAIILSRKLRSKGLNVKSVWIRAPHTVAFLFSTFLVQTGFFRVLRNTFGKKRRIPRVNANRLLGQIWSMTELVGVMPVILFRAWLPFRRGNTIVAERYVMDTIVSISYYTGDPAFVKSRLSRLLLHFIPEGSLLVKLDSDYEALKKRRGFDVESRDFISFQKKAYDTLAEMTGASSIDTTKLDVSQTSEIVFALLTRAHEKPQAGAGR